MIELFLNAIPNVLSAMFVGSTAGGLVQVCEEDLPKLSKFKDKMIEESFKKLIILISFIKLR